MVCQSFFGPPLPSAQVSHTPQQIKTPKDLQIGNEYLLRHEDLGKRITLLGIDKKNQSLTVRIEEGPDQGKTESVYWADTGLAPYEGGSWNSSNYIVPA